MRRDSVLMDGLRIVVVGLGSMGRRRIGILRRLCPKARIVGVDSRADRRSSLTEDLDLPAFENLNQALDSAWAQALFVCSSPLSHSGIVLEGQRRGCHTFSELNLVADGYKDIMKVSSETGKVAFLSSTQLYRREIGTLPDVKARMGAPFQYSYHVGQYLPDWHPWEPIEDFFVSDRRTNGCREILAIELPWMLRCFGPVKAFQVIRRKLSSLPLDYEDTYVCLFEHENGTVGSLTVDLVSRKPVRNLKITAESGTLSWSGTPDTLTFFSPGEGEVPLLPKERFSQDPRYSRTIVEDAYEAEIQAFLQAIRGDASGVLYGYREDLETLNLIDRIEGVPAR